MGLGHRKILAGIKWLDFSEFRTKIKLILFRVATRGHGQLIVLPANLNLVVSTCVSILFALCGFCPKSSNSADLQRNNLVIVL
jgi:hypothetical protein